MRILRAVLVLAAMITFSAAVVADDYDDTIARFKKAGATADYFNYSYGYAVFPTIAKGGLIIGGAHGNGRVYQKGQYVGDTSVTQVSIGLQIGGQGYSQIIFFEDKRAFDEFTTGSYEFDAGVSAVAIDKSAASSAGTTGTQVGTSKGEDKSSSRAGGYYKGVAVFTIIKGGAMAEAAVAGQKFSYKPRASS
jgi:lipid-binding SYLF domain-containing protein